MKKSDRENLYKLFRDHGDALGTSRTTILALQAFIESIRELKCQQDEIEGLVMELSDAIKNTEPKIIPLIHMVEKFEADVKDHFGKGLSEFKVAAIRILEEKIEAYKATVDQVVEKGLPFVQDGDVILVHSASTVVSGILARAKEVHNRDFKVLVLKQDLVKTKPLINALRKAQIPYTVVPEYTLDHHIQEATKLFLGAVSVTEDRAAVCAAGTANIVSLCHTNHLPVCLFVSTLKISHQPACNQLIHIKEETRCQNNFTYCITTHSHSLVPLEMIDHFVSELGQMGKHGYSEYLL